MECKVVEDVVDLLKTEYQLINQCVDEKCWMNTNIYIQHYAVDAWNWLNHRFPDHWISLGVEQLNTRHDYLI